jgi:hypothetical protein
VSVHAVQPEVVDRGDVHVEEVLQPSSMKAKPIAGPRWLLPPALEIIGSMKGEAIKRVLAMELRELP